VKKIKKDPSVRVFWSKPSRQLRILSNIQSFRRLSGYATIGSAVVLVSRVTLFAHRGFADSGSAFGYRYLKLISASDNQDSGLSVAFELRIPQEHVDLIRLGRDTQQVEA
jgi:hypothetical protein